jgi:hypothetical protein
VDNSHSETGFSVERSADGTTWSEVASTAPDATTYVDSGLVSDKEYRYRVRAFNAAGFSPYSNVASATTATRRPAGRESAPAAPSQLQGSPVAPSRIHLTWQDNAGNEQGFAVERSAPTTAWQEVATTGADDEDYLDAGLAPGTTYHYRVRAYNRAGHSLYSNVVSVTTPEEPEGPTPEPVPTEEPPPSPPEEPQPGEVTMTLSSSHAITPYGEGFELSGFVGAAETCTDLLEVTVTSRIHGREGETLVGTTPVGGSGTWGMRVVAPHNATYVAEVRATETCSAATSPPVEVLVKAKITLLKVPKRCKGPASVTGEVLPAKPGTQVSFERRTRGRWRSVAESQLDSRSRFRVALPQCGAHRAVWLQQDQENASAAERFRLVRRKTRE